MVQNFQRFYLYEAQNTFQVSYPTSVKFPAVTLCNLNRVRASRMAEVYPDEGFCHRCAYP